MKHFALVGLFLIVVMPLVAVAQVNINVNAPAPPPPPGQDETAPQEGVQEVPGAPVPPPPLSFATPPDMVVVPSGGADVYLVPGTPGLYFHGGNWYRFHSGYWFRSGLYSGPWAGIGAGFVPGYVAAIPPDYVLGVPAGYHRIHYGEFHDHWREWGHSHYWGGQPWYRDHALHHWGGRAFVNPAVGRRGDFHHGLDKPGVVHGDRRVGDRGPATKPGVHGQGKPGGGHVGGGPGGGSKMVANRGQHTPAGHGGVSHGGNIGHAGAKPASVSHGGAGHGGESAGHNAGHSAHK